MRKAGWISLAALTIGIALPTRRHAAPTPLPEPALAEEPIEGAVDVPEREADGDCPSCSVWPIRWVDGHHAILRRSSETSLVDVEDGLSWGPLPAGSPKDQMLAAPDGSELAIIDEPEPVGTGAVLRLWRWRDGTDWEWRIADLHDCLERNPSILPLEGAFAPGPRACGQIQADPDGRSFEFLDASDEGRTVSVWSWKQHRVRAKLARDGTGPRAAVGALDLGASRAAVSYDDGTLAVFDTVTGAIVGTTHPRQLRDLALDASGQWVAWRSASFHLAAWNVSTGRLLSIPERCQCFSASLARGPGVGIFASGNLDGSVCRIDATTATVRRFPSRLDSNVEPHPRTCRMTTGELTTPPPFFDGPAAFAATDVAVSADGRTITFMGSSPHDGSPLDEYIDVATGRIRSHETVHPRVATLSPDGATTVTVDPARRRIWMSDTWSSVIRWQSTLPGTPNQTLVFSPDGKRLLVGGESLFVVDARTGAVRTAVP
jgi:WD40 repeat protein